MKQAPLRRHKGRIIALALVTILVTEICLMAYMRQSQQDGEPHRVQGRQAASQEPMSPTRQAIAQLTPSPLVLRYGPDGSPLPEKPDSLIERILELLSPTNGTAKPATGSDSDEHRQNPLEGETKGTSRLQVPPMRQNQPR